jgi:hypothetical protein
MKKKRTTGIARVRTVARVGSLVPFEEAKPLMLERMRRASRITESGCWEWTLSPSRKKYIQVFFRGVRITIHRLSYWLHHGPIPVGKMVCHHCDNMRCWNPAHLWVGTNQENMRDCSRKGRVNWSGLREWNEQQRAKSE